MIPTKAELDALRVLTASVPSEIEDAPTSLRNNRLADMLSAINPAMIAHLLACEAALVKLVEAQNNLTSPKWREAPRIAAEQFQFALDATRALIGD